MASLYDLKCYIFCCKQIVIAKFIPEFENMNLILCETFPLVLFHKLQKDNIYVFFF